MISDGGDNRLWQAETMNEALELAEEAYIEENWDDLESPEDEERVFYRTELLESCALIGELANPTTDLEAIMEAYDEDEIERLINSLEKISRDEDDEIMNRLSKVINLSDRRDSIEELNDI